MTDALHVVRFGAGPAVLLIHGSATDHATWLFQLTTLGDRIAMVAYDRRSTGSVAGEVADAAGLLAPGMIVCGSSFGAVVALELACLRPRDVAGLVLIEPPLGAGEAAMPGSQEMLAAFDRRVADHGGEAAAELFLRAVLGDDIVERMPPAMRARSLGKWRQIRADAAALLAHRARRDALAALDLPCLLVGGERSPSPAHAGFAPTLAWLAKVLPRTRRVTIAGAGHMLHAERHRAFGELLVGFAERPDVA
jgi:pimeloyl-ACP methyl ester carboxylesterase